ncbi:MAG: hypothetical protein NZ519_09240 [Bacteroidia bacterium]|nr:hypothetical protein [Bacteroidia bacterium]MDW8302993.1 hypothetical protein [Bacteroidia bacterium]
MTNYIKNLSLLILLTTVILLPIFYAWANQTGIWIASIAILTSGSIALLSAWIIYQGIQNTQHYVFMNKIISSMLVKFALSILATLICVWQFKPFKVQFVVAFFVTYLVFTIYEVKNLMKWAMNSPRDIQK